MADAPALGLMASFKVPDTPLIAAGAVGGPFVMYATTPARNALTLASKDKVRKTPSWPESWANCSLL